MTLASKLMAPALIFALTLVSGLWLSHLGKPYNGLVFNIHKLIALGAAVAAGMQLYKLIAKTEVQAMLIVLIVLAALGIVTLFVTGAFMSLGNPAYKLLLTLHRVAPILAVASATGVVYLLIG
jgi:hypothetical protein